MGIFHDRMLGPEMVAALNQLWAAFAASAYPPSGGMFPPGTLAAPSVRGTADPATGWNFVDGEAQLSVGGLLKARATAAGFLDAAGNPLLSAGNAVGLLSQGALCQFDRTAGGDVYRYADGRMRIDTPWVTGYATGRTEVTLPAALSGSGAASMSVIPVDNWDYKVTCYANSAVASFYAENGSTGNLWRISVEGRWKA